MQQPKTTPTWLVELRQRLETEKRATRAQKPAKVKKVKKAKLRHKKKNNRDYPEDLNIPACPVAIHYADKHRDEPTKGEKAMGVILQESLSPRNIVFARQVPISRFIADFLVPKKRLVIEVDGEYHFFRGKEDFLRTKALKRLGYNVIRFTNHEVLTNPLWVRNEILERCVGPHAVFRLD